MNFKHNRDKYLGIIGQFLLPIFPNRVEKIQSEQFTLSEFGQGRNKIDHFLRYGLVYRAIQKGDLDSLAQYHKNYWKGDAGAQYHEDYAFMFEESFVAHFAYIVEYINQIAHEADGFNSLFEIGSGSGQLLDYLAAHVNDVEKFVGIDLSPTTVKRCNERYGRSNVSFVAADGDKWIRENGQPNAVFMSHRGVLEYFPQDRLLSFFRYIRETYAPCLLITIEPVGTGHDLENTTNSQPYSNEYSFSHNYPYLIKQAGFDILDTHLQPSTQNNHLLAVVATAGMPIIELPDRKALLKK